MEKNYEKAIIIEPLFDGDNIDEKIEEIEALLLASGADHFMTVCQKIREVNPATIVGAGKLDEIKVLIDENKVNLVVFDGELSPSQQNNIADHLDCKVIGRTTLILDIFAMRAMSMEGKVLVELAQLKYLYPRLSGKGIKLSRLGGGIGTRGPGETQLETDRRHIRTRIKFLEKNLNEIEKRRISQRNRRNRNGVKTVALVGYTNTGKSTLLNLLCSSSVLEKDQLFATLDPTARKAEINGYSVVIIDTVGFVKNLPPDLTKAFKSTLDCAVNADLVLNVCDLSSNWQMQIESTNNTLNEIGVTGEVLLVGNKCDKVENFESFSKDIICISAKQKRGIENLKHEISKRLFSELIKIKVSFDYKCKLNIQKLKQLATAIAIDYTKENVVIHAEVDKKNYQRFCELVDSIKSSTNEEI